MSFKKAIIATSLGVAIFVSVVPSTFALGLNAGFAGGSANQATRMANLRTRGDTEITRRIAALNALVTRIGNMKRLSASRKSTFTSEIQTEITNLTTLKAKIDADTDLSTLQTDIKSIVASYRVFALFMPQINIISYADRIGAIVDAMNAIVGKLQDRITKAKAAGKDVTTAQADLTSIQSQLTDANTQITAAIAQVTPLTPSGYPGNKTTLLAARTTLQNVVTNDLKPARQEIEAIIKSLK